MSTISASTTSTTAYKVTADTTGTLVLQTGASPTTAVTIGSDQVVTFAKTPTSTGSGSVATNTAYGTGSLNGNTTGSLNTAIGYQAAYSNVTGTRLTALGYSAGYASTGNYNVFIGSYAGQNNTGSSNTAVGDSALSASGSGAYNSAIGQGAMSSNTSGINSVAFGYLALAATTTGGYTAALGTQALYSNTTCSYNTAVGYQALYTANRTADVNGYNCAIGAFAGYSITTGNYNTLIGSSGNGYGAGHLITTGTKNTVLGGFNGNQGGLDIRTTSNYIVLADGDGNPRAHFNQYGTLVMQVGTSAAPSVNSNLTNSIHLGNGSMGAVSVNPTVFFGNAYSSSAGVPIYCGNWPATNNWGIGLHDGSASRNIRIGGTTQGTGGQQWDGAYANIYAGSYTNASDYRIKENVVGLDDGALASVLALRPVKYRIKKIEGDEQENRTEIGFIAHEVQEHIPEVVIGEKDAVDGGGNEQHQGVDYAKLTAVLAKAIQEQQAIIDTLTNRITALEAK